MQRALIAVLSLSLALTIGIATGLAIGDDPPTQATVASATTTDPASEPSSATAPTPVAVEPADGPTPPPSPTGDDADPSEDDHDVDATADADADADTVQREAAAGTPTVARGRTVYEEVADPDPAGDGTVVEIPAATPHAAAPEPTLVWGFDASVPAADRTRPALGQVTTDPIYGTEIRRVSSAEGTRFDRNTYSRRQAENADGTMFFTYHGEAEYRVYDRESLDLVRILPIHPDAEPQWHPTDPTLVRYINGPNSYTGELRLYEIDVTDSADDGQVIADLTAPVQAVMPDALYLKDRAEGSPSADGNRYAWLVYDENEDIIGIVSYDLATNTVLGTIDQIETDVGLLDWVSASPTGAYVLAGYATATYVYDADLTNRRLVNNKGEHSDIALDADGGDVFVHIDFSAGPNGGWLMAVDLDTLEATRLFDLYDDANTSIHISGKGYERPGWVMVSTYNCKVPGAWSCEKVMAVELATGRVLNLAHTYNCGDNYWTETHAVVNRSFTRVYFNTDHGSCGIDAEVMELTLPDF